LEGAVSVGEGDEVEEAAEAAEPGPGSVNIRGKVADEDEVGLTIAVDVGDGVSAGGYGPGEGVFGVQDEARWRGNR